MYIYIYICQDLTSHPCGRCYNPLRMHTKRNVTCTYMFMKGMNCHDEICRYICIYVRTSLVITLYACAV